MDFVVEGIKKYKSNIDTTKIHPSIRDASRLVIDLSQKEDKSKDEVIELYKAIDELVMASKKMDKTKKGSVASEILLYAFYPKILTSTGVIYRNELRDYRDRISIYDLFQESYMTFLKMIFHYKKSKSTFGYYFGRYFRKYIISNMSEMINYVKMTPVRMIADSQAKDYLLYDKDSLLDLLIEKTLLEDINKIIKKYKKVGKTKTVDTVCKNFFEGKSCQEIANDLGLSYHAVYQVKERLMIKLADMLNQHKYCNYSVTFSKDKYRLFKLEERTKKIDTLVSIKVCKNCGKRIYNRMIPREDRTKGFVICSKCETISYLRGKIA